jgi:hypothetical protein
MTRNEMMSRISPSEYLEWRVLERIEPYGEVAEYHRNGQLMSLIANFVKDKDTPAYVPSDFMPQFEDPVVKTGGELNSVLLMMQQMQEAQVNGR